MQNINKYKRKRFSVLGDSISTLFGYSEPADAVFYEGANMLRADVVRQADTWWGRVIDSLGARLLVNDSFSGSMVTKHPACLIPSYSASDERTSSLGKGYVHPDVIMVFMGVNDWGHGMRPRAEGTGDLTVFSTAYGIMLDKLRENYPEAEIWCLTLPFTKKESGSFSFPYRYSGVHIEEYSEVIRSLASERGHLVAELFDEGDPIATLDGFHPTREGMERIAERVLNAVKERSAARDA